MKSISNANALTAPRKLRRLIQEFVLLGEISNSCENQELLFSRCSAEMELMRRRRQMPRIADEGPEKLFSFLGCECTGRPAGIFHTCDFLINYY
jgi:hypothetical protein